MARDTLFLLIAIVLAIPLSIIANLFTPRLRDWWATTSQRRLERRIAELESVLKTKTPRFEEVLVTIIRKISFGLVGITVLLVGHAFSSVGPEVFPSPLSPHKDAIVSAGVIIFFYIFTIIQFLDVIYIARGYLQRLPDSKAQTAIRKRIEDLRKK